MSDTQRKQSPIHAWLEAHPPAEVEREALQTLALCDMSQLEKLGIKGRDAEEWLSKQGVEMPKNIYDTCRLADGGVIVRVATDEFLLESGMGEGTVQALAAKLESDQSATVRVERQEGTFLLVGSQAIDVLAQTCGVNFREQTLRKLVMTRVAGVSCGLIPDPLNDLPSYRIWTDYTYALYLWETLAEICEDLGGHVVGAACLFPEHS